MKRMVRDGIFFFIMWQTKTSYSGYKYYSDMLGIIIFALTYAFSGAIIFRPLVYSAGPNSLRHNSTNELS